MRELYIMRFRVFYSSFSGPFVNQSTIESIVIK